MTILALSTKGRYAEMFDAAQLRSIAEIISSLRMPAYEYSWMFMGLAGAITFYLFYKSRYIPRFFSLWGMFTYTSLTLYPIAKILIADLPREIMFILYPGALFELGAGIWLLIMGISFPNVDNSLPNKANS